MKFQDVISALPDELGHHLKNQTATALQVTNPNNYAYFKFIYQDSLVAASTVITEYHLVLDWKTVEGDVRRQLKEIIANIPAQTPINISFAGRSLEEDQPLADLGVAYGDKIYFNIGDPRGVGPYPKNVTGWIDYFRRVAMAVKGDPGLYEDIVDAACDRVETTTNIDQWSDQDWKLILLTRNLPGIYADVTTGRSILKVTQRLIKALDSALINSNGGLAYHSANVLEWLAYLKPRMFEGVDLYEGDQTRQKLARLLLQVADSATNMPGPVRMEAIWAIGWASVASQEFGRLVYEKLVKYEEVEPPSPIVMTLRCAALRSFLYPTPYFIAATSQQAGWFQASIVNQHQFRRIAISDKHEKALVNFRTVLEQGLLPSKAGE